MLYLFYYNILQSIKIYNTIKEIWRKDCLIIAGKSRYTLKEPKVTKEQFKVSKNYAENVSILCKHVEENFFSPVN